MTGTTSTRISVKKPLIITLVVALGLLLIMGITIAVIDPFFHYHGPLKGLQYSLLDERYENDGIARHYDYEAMITGTSMTQNFRASQMEELWGVKTVKTAFSGASYHELAEHIERSANYNPELKYVLCSLDGTRLFTDWDWDSYEGIPEYLYDDNPFNDIQYLLNFDAFIKCLNAVNYTRAGNTTTDMDMYGAWYPWATFSAEQARLAYTRQQPSGLTVLSEADKEQVTANICNNYLQLAQAYPDIQFYFFLPPYSELYWKNICEKGELHRQLDGEQLAVELLLTADNVHVYGFEDMTDVTMDLDNYQDTLHYGQWVNESMMEDIYSGAHKLDEDNYVYYFQSLYDCYVNSAAYEPDADGYVQASQLVETEASEEIAEVNPSNPYVEGLSVPTYVTKVNEDYFIVDCYHDQIIYSDDMDKPIYEWQVMTSDISRGHTLASDGIVYLADDTENNRIIVMERVDTDEGHYYVETQEFTDIGVRPHYIVYDEATDIFYGWSSENGEMYLFRRDHEDNRVYLTEVHQIESLANTYVRSFSIIDGDIYLVAGIGHPVITRVSVSDFIVLEEYPVPDTMAGMAQVIKIDGYYYVTISTDNTGSQDAATMVRCKELTDLSDGNYEDVYSYFIGGGTPYCINEVDGDYYLCEHRLPGHSVWRFHVDNDEITDVETVQ